MNKRQRDQLAQQQAKWQHTPGETRTMTGRLFDTQTRPKQHRISGHSIDYIIVDDVDYTGTEERIAQYLNLTLPADDAFDQAHKHSRLATLYAKGEHHE